MLMKDDDVSTLSHVEFATIFTIVTSGGVSDDSSTSSCISPLKISTGEGPIFHVYLPHRPKSALGCAGVLVSRFKMKIGSLILTRCRDKKKKKPRASTPSGSGSWKKKPFSSS